jgi:hypothetical protein
MEGAGETLHWSTDDPRQRASRSSCGASPVSIGVEPDPSEMAERYGADMPVPEWRERLVCSQCGSRDVDMVVTGTERR